jgi:hypothetical protein
LKLFMRTAFIQIPAILCAIFLSCVTGEEIIRITGEAGTGGVPGRHYAVYKNQDFTIYVEPVDHTEWKHLADFSAFTKKSGHTGLFRIPKLQYFHVIIANTSSTPAKFDSVRLIYNGTMKSPLGAEEILQRCKSPLYDFLNFANILGSRSLLSDKREIKEINYDKDTSPQPDDGIPAFFTVLKIVAFDWILVKHRTFTLRMSIVSGENKKSVDFIFIKSEYRSKDKFFSIPVNEAKTDENKH